MTTLLTLNLLIRLNQTHFLSVDNTDTSFCMAHFGYNGIEWLLLCLKTRDRRGKSTDVLKLVTRTEVIRMNRSYGWKESGGGNGSIS